IRDTAAVLEVRDGGPGMRPPDLVAMFERFRKGGASGGAGLGLALVREIVLRHGGRVTLNCNPEGGTTATWRVPRAPPASPCRHTSRAMRIPALPLSRCSERRPGIAMARGWQAICAGSGA